MRPLRADRPACPTRSRTTSAFRLAFSGADLATRAILQAQKFGAQFSSPSQVARLEFEKDKTLVWFDSEPVSARCVLIATGAEYRKLDVPKREQLESLGVYYAATPTELQLCRGSEGIVVGGGNSAGQAVMFLSEETRRVFLLLHGGGGLRKSMSSYLADSSGSQLVQGIALLMFLEMFKTG